MVFIDKIFFVLADLNFVHSSHFHFFFVLNLVDVAGSTTVDVGTFDAEVQAKLSAMIKTSDWCNKVAENVTAANVTVLHIPSQIRAIHDICGNLSTNVRFASTVVPGTKLPTGQPTSRPSSYVPPLPQRRRSFPTFACIIFIIIIIACLRCCLLCIAISGKKTEEKSHFYDILVILNDDEEAIFENIRHEDIAFTRRFDCSLILLSSSRQQSSCFLFSFLLYLI